MNSVLIAVLVFIAYILAYRFYCRFLSKRIFGIDPQRITPAHRYRDGMDFVPTRRSILFGHHFTSIAGAGPIVGPAIAVIWGWLPALVWVVVGSIFMGAVHDFGALVVSARHRGKSIGEITRELIGPRARTLFLLFIFFALLIVLAVFALVIGVLFMMYPETVLPVWLQIPVAVALGLYIYRFRGNPLVPSLVALALLYGFMYLGILYPFKLPPFVMGNEVLTWVVVLLLYAYVASILPVWVLLQPRDYINSHQLFVGLGLLYLGLFVGMPQVVAPAVNPTPSGAPSMLPFLFITVACGAISGFHSLVSSGTTVKQLDNERDMPFIGYGSMLIEGVLATLVILVCTAGFPSLAAWTQHYADWNTAQGLGAKVGAFVEGGAAFLSYVGIPQEFGRSIVAVFVISFAATTLDTATRIQRYVIAELAEDMKLKPLTGRHPATMVAVSSAFFLSMLKWGKGGLILWPLFGTVNQLMGGLALLTVTMYLVRLRKPVYYTLLPMAFMLAMSALAMTTNLVKFFDEGNYLLLTVGAMILALEVWLVVEAVGVFRTLRERGLEEVPAYLLEEEE